LIGIFANHNANAAISSLLNKFTLKQPIMFGSMVGATYLSGKEFKMGADLLTTTIRLNDGRIINPLSNLSEFLSASVDAVKDPVLNFMNLNTITADTGAMLARVGYSMEDIALLFNQPIIRSLCELHLRGNDFNITNSVVKLKNEYVQILSDMGSEYEKETNM